MLFEGCSKFRFEQRSMRYLKVTLKIFICALLTTVIFLALAEFIIRNFTSYGILFYVNLDAEADYVLYDKKIPFMGIDLKEKIRVMLEKKSKDNINQLNKYKIMVLGDSIAASGELREGELAFPELLNRILKKDYPEIDFDFFVFACGGYSTVEEVLGYERYSKDFMPDLVILTYCDNDIGESCRRRKMKNGKYSLAYYNMVFPYLDNVPCNHFLVEKSLVIRLINKVVIDFFQKCGMQINIKFHKEAEQRIFKSFEKLYWLTQKTNTPVLVVVFPYFGKDFDISRIRMHENIKRWCGQLKFLHIDLLDAYRKYEPKQLQCIQENDFCHPNAMGHKIAAEAMAEKIKQISSFIERIASARGK